MKNTVSYLKTTSRAVFSFILGFIFLFAIIDFYKIADNVQVWLGEYALATGIVLAGMMFLCVIGLIFGMVNLWDMKWKNPINNVIERFRETLGRFRWLIVFIAAFLPTYTILYTPLGSRLTGYGFRSVTFFAIVGIIAVLVTRKKENPLSWSSVVVSTLFVGVVFSLGKAFVTVNDYPLSLSWSEGNRIWDYSILFGRELYNFPHDQHLTAFIDPGRQTLWGLPFLIPNVSIILVRLWSFIVNTLPYFFLGWMSFRFLPGNKNQWFWIGLWAFLFLNQGPIYTPLIFCAILVINKLQKPIWVTLPLVFLAGYYAQLSRFTWMFTPSIWAMLFALLDVGDIKHRISIKNWMRISMFGLVGLLGGLVTSHGLNLSKNYFTKIFRFTGILSPFESTASNLNKTSYAAEVLRSVNNDNVIGDQFLLWDRLLPNPTYGLGIILGVILAVGPIIILLVYLVYSKRWKLNRWQILGLLGTLGSLLFVGIVISTKIGGGGDLHNMDMFLISILLASGFAWENGGTKLFSELDFQPLWTKVVLFLVVFIPSFTPWINAGPLNLPPDKDIQSILDLLENETSLITAEGGEILFMDQRQLLTFGYLDNIPLVPEYEKKLVMDKAMSGNLKYFDSFYKDISDQRFALIIADPQPNRYSDANEAWGEENDTWVRWVTKPLLCYYEPVYKIEKPGIWLLMPRETAGYCAFP
jgi:hypothetical protein